MWVSNHHLTFSLLYGSRFINANHRILDLKSNLCSNDRGYWEGGKKNRDRLSAWESKWWGTPFRRADFIDQIIEYALPDYRSWCCTYGDDDNGTQFPHAAQLSHSNWPLPARKGALICVKTSSLRWTSGLHRFNSRILNNEAYHTKSRFLYLSHWNYQYFFTAIQMYSEKFF